MVAGMEGGVANIPRHDWKGLLRDRAARVAARLGLAHKGIWAMEGSVEGVGVVVTEAVEIDAFRLAITVEPPRTVGPEGFTATRPPSRIRRLLRRLRRGTVRVGRGARAIELRAEDRTALELWLTDRRRHILETLTGFDGPVQVTRSSIRVEPPEIWRDAAEVERTIRVLVTAARRLGTF
jgi:hypothetical protein